MKTFLNGKVNVWHGDSREVLRGFEADRFDSVVTDPPYGLQFMGREWDKLWRNSTEADSAYVDRTNGELTSRARRLPDYSAAKPVQMQEWHTEWAREVLRVLKPGGHVLAFSGTRTYHRLACAIEDAGFEIRDQIQWLFGSGFPKSHNAGDGWGTALKPANEPIVLARKPLIGTVAANVLEHGTGALNIDGCRVASEKETGWGGGAGLGYHGGTDPNGGEARPINGRWPANVIHDGSEEVLAAFPDAPGQQFASRDDQRTQGTVYGAIAMNGNGYEPRGDTGSAARFFYTAKADSDDRIGSKHPTVKPVDLMRYLCRLITPPGGRVLDPFAGTGTTAEAAFYEGFNCTLIEREAEYIADIERRMKLCLAGPKEREREITKEKTKGKPVDAGPLFQGMFI